MEWFAGFALYALAVIFFLRFFHHVAECDKEAEQMHENKDKKSLDKPHEM